MGELISLLNATIQLLVGIGLFIVLIRIGRLIEKFERSFDERNKDAAPK
jgi:hypothetical protein